MKNLLTLSATLLIGVLIGMQCEKYLRKRDSIRQGRRALGSTPGEQTIRQSRREVDLTLKKHVPGSHMSFSEYALRMGIFATPIDSYMKERLGLQQDKGFVVSRLQKHGPAMEAGIARGDVISRIGNQPVCTKQEFVDAMDASCQSGSTVTIEIFTRKKKKTVSVKLR